MLREAIIIAIVTYIVKIASGLLGKPHIGRPLVACAIVGFALGDLQTGIVMGASLELVFLGIVSIGGATPADVATGAVFGSAFAILLGEGLEVALALSVPIALVAKNLFGTAYKVFAVATVPWMDNHIQNGNVKGFLKIHFMHLFLKPLPYAIVGFIGVYYGVDYVQAMMAAIPESVLDGMRAVGSLLPALGFAMLIKSIWSGKLAVYFFLGFILAIYLKLPLLAIAALGFIVAAIIVISDMAQKNTGSVAKQQEEGFFDE